MGLYIVREDVRVRLIGKVRFTDNEDEENKMSLRLLDRLINEAEADVEQDLSPRYAAPFQTDSGLPFAKLPLRPTREILRTLCELKAVIRVLETDFGAGTVVDAAKYAESIGTRYQAMLDKHMAKKKEGLGWAYPPLPGLAFNYMNTEADDGYAGMVLSTSRGDGDFPAERIQNPSQSWWNADFRDEELARVSSIPDLSRIP